MFIVLFTTVLTLDFYHVNKTVRQIFSQHVIRPEHDLALSKFVL